MFQLHPVLQKDTVLIGEFSLSLVLISKDANYPWVILVPKRSEVKEIYQLSLADRQSLLEESCLLASALVEIFKPDKLNVATIGNMVPQLHCHVVGRFKNDPAWPGPIWGVGTAQPYAEDAGRDRLATLRADLISAFKHL